MFTITKILRRPKVSKAGKPYESVSIQVKEYGTKWISGFGGKENINWKEGDSVNLTIVPNGEYLNFQMPEGQKAAGTGGTSGSEILSILKSIERKLDTVLETREEDRKDKEMFNNSDIEN